MSDREDPIDYPGLRRLVTPDRLAPYLASTGGDLRQAFDLYDWNVEASAAVLAVVARVEVVLRNALDQQMQVWAVGRGLADWMHDPPLDDRGRQDVAEAIRRASPGRRVPTHGHIVAELSLGFWRYLTSQRYLTVLWIPYLATVFPHVDGDIQERRAVVEHDVRGIHFLRNRAAHHEPIYRRNLHHDLERMLRLLGAIDANAQWWVRARERVTKIIGQRPLL